MRKAFRNAWRLLVTLNYCATLAALLVDDGCVLLLLLGCCAEDELCGVEDDEAELAGVELTLLVVDWATDELVALDARVADEYVLVLYVAWYAVELDDSELDDFFLWCFFLCDELVYVETSESVSFVLTGSRCLIAKTTIMIRRTARSAKSNQRTYRCGFRGPFLRGPLPFLGVLFLWGRWKPKPRLPPFFCSFLAS